MKIGELTNNLSIYNLGNNTTSGQNGKKESNVYIGFDEVLISTGRTQEERDEYMNKIRTSDTYQNIIHERKEKSQAPYSELADAYGRIEYNGVVYQCDYDSNSICLGNMEETDNILDIPLSGGGRLRVNRNNFDDLAKSIGLFSAEDVKRIMHAISTDAKIKNKNAEIEKQIMETFQNLAK